MFECSYQVRISQRNIAEINSKKRFIQSIVNLLYEVLRFQNSQLHFHDDSFSECVSREYFASCRIMMDFIGKHIDVEIATFQMILKKCCRDIDNIW